MQKKLLVLGDYNPEWETHRLTNSSIDHCLRHLADQLVVNWCSPKQMDERELEEASGIWVATGAPYSSMNNALKAIRHARENNIPCLGTCQGFQHIMLEYAQTFMGMHNPGHQEYDGTIPKPLISKLACSLRGQEGVVNLSEGSTVSQIYASPQTTERYYCSYGINPDFVPRIDNEVLRISGIGPDGTIRIVEYRQHPFLIGTLFVPQARSQAENPHPLVLAFIRSILALSQQAPDR